MEKKDKKCVNILVTFSISFFAFSISLTACKHGMLHSPGPGFPFA